MQELKVSLRHELIESHTEKLGLRSAQRLAPTQTRMVPLVLEQNAPCHANYITFTLNLVELRPMEVVKDFSRQINLEVTLHIRQLQLWTADDYNVIRVSFLFENANPTVFLVKPPIRSNKDSGTATPLLALRKSTCRANLLCLLKAITLSFSWTDGAGVDIFASTFWADAIPRQNSSWIIIPPGRTEWVA